MIKYSIVAMIGTAAIFTLRTDGAREGLAPNLTLIQATWCCGAFFLPAPPWAPGDPAMGPAGWAALPSTLGTPTSALPQLLPWLLVYRYWFRQSIIQQSRVSKRLPSLNMNKKQRAAVVDSLHEVMPFTVCLGSS